MGKKIKIINGKVITSQRIIENATVLVEDDIITEASEKEKAKALPILKDNDFLEDNNKLYLQADAKDQLIVLLKSDTDFLTRLHLMDYSLLVGK